VLIRRLSARLSRFEARGVPSACLDGLRAELSALKALRTTNPAGSC
jgi:hypothetical protein